MDVNVYVGLNPRLYYFAFSRLLGNYSPYKEIYKIVM